MWRLAASQSKLCAQLQNNEFTFVADMSLTSPHGQTARQASANPSDRRDKNHASCSGLNNDLSHDATLRVA